jgi:translation initiation factor IF-2
MSEPRSSERFGGGALVATLIVGLIVGFAAGYMAKPRALQSRPAQEMASAPGTDAAVAPASEAPALSAPAPSAPAPLAPAPKAPTPAPKAPKAPEAQTSIGRLLVRSSPSGATVTVDGVTRGVTPLALRDVALGSRNVVVARRGYIAEDRRVVLTGARPSRSLEVRLSAEAAKPPAPPRPSTPATLGRPAPATASTGTLDVDSRPPGASVTINGRPSGTTPLSLDKLDPGEYQVGLALPGYQPFSTTVRVVAGARARAAASLSVQERK